jgi:hypothetical protein
LGEVMSSATNAKTQKKPGRNSNSLTENTPKELGGSQGAGRIHGTQPDRSDFENISRENCSQQSDGGNSSLGKILARLKQLELEHFSYVGEHQQRLEARLDESKQRELKFRQVIQELEQDIQSLMSGKTE